MIAAWVERGRIRASYRTDGELQIRDIGKAEYTAFVRDPNVLRDDSAIVNCQKDFPGWWKLNFADYDTRKRALSNNPSILYEADVSPVRRFLSDHKCTIDQPRRVYLDIETDSRVPFTHAVLGAARLLSFALVDEEGNKNTAVLDADDDQAEAELWAHLWTLMAQYDQVAAWNGDRFDFEVMKAKCQTLGKQYGRLLEPYWEHRRRLLLVDHLACFRRHHMAAESGDDKCLGLGTPILKYDGSVVCVENVKEGDLLMGPDSKPRVVSGLHRGTGQMYRIVPTKGEAWTCNEAHIMTLVDTAGKYGIRDISIRELLNMTPAFRNRWKLFQPEDGVTFNNPQPESLEVDPYFLGLWLGDGCKSLKNIEIYTIDPEIVEACNQVAKAHNLRISVRIDPRTQCKTVAIVGPRGRSRNPLIDSFRNLMCSGIRIPDSYLHASKEARLELLAGLIDSDGNYYHGCYLFSQKCPILSTQVEYLARSVGLAAIRSQHLVNGTVYQRVHICGNVDIIPARINRKKASPRKQKKNALRTGFTIEPIGVDDFFGFELDGDGRFLLGNFVVTHNTSFKLNDVCQALIGEGKEVADPQLEHLVGAKGMGGSTWALWEAGGYARQKLVDYNLQDTALLPKLERETGYLELQQTIAEVTLTFVNSHGLKPSPQVDGYLLRMAHERQTHLPSKKEPTGEEKEYEGAFVLPPQKLGIHRTVHVCDFKSLYPTVIRTFNISPETKAVGIDPCVAFRTGIEFDTALEGMLPAACREAMDLREHWKQEYKKDPNNKAAERKSKAYKIFNNSMYGVMGNVYSRYYDPQIAESITLGAKHLNEKTADAARERGWEVLYMDTDSLFVTGCSVDEFKSFVTWCNSDLYPSILAEQNVPKEQQCIALDYEKCFDRLIFPLGNKGEPAAKRYIGSYLHYGFKPKTKPEIRGLEYMRADSVRYARRMQHEAMELLLKGTDSDTLNEWVKRKRELFFEGYIPLEDIVLSKGISQALDAYKSVGPHVRVARELEARGEDISEGTRISYVVTDGSESPTVVIAAADYKGAFDRHHYWSKAIYPATMRVLGGAYPEVPWKRWIPRRPRKVSAQQLNLI